MKTIEITDQWPGGISDGLTLPCSICDVIPAFDYGVKDAFWLAVAPVKYRLDVICLPCLDTLATAMGFNVADNLESIQFTGIGKTIVFCPIKVYNYTKTRPDKVPT